MIFLLNGTDRSDIFVSGSLNIDNTVGERAVASFNLRTGDRSLNILSGTPIEIQDNDQNILFNGLLDEPGFAIVPGTDEIIYACSSVDNNSRADKRLVALTFTGQTLGHIVRAILDDSLSQDGITEGHIEEGPTLERVVFPYVHVSEAFDELAELTGTFWNIDYQKQLHFYIPETTEAPKTVSKSSKVFDVTVKRNKQKYVNVQYVRGGQTETDILTERFKGDGERETFTVGFKLARVPTVRLNGVVQTVGIRGLEENKQFYWQKDDKEITQDRDDTPLTDTDVLEVEYIGFFPVIVQVDNPESVNERAELEGNSGFYEESITENKIDDREYAVKYGQGKLRKYGIIKEEINFKSHDFGYEPGQSVVIDLDEYHVSGQYLIESVNCNHITDDRFEYRVTAVNGEPNHKWEHFFRNISQRAEGLSVRENETLLLLNTMSERQGWSETSIQTVNACPIPGDRNTYYYSRRQLETFDTGPFPSEDLYPC